MVFMNPAKPGPQGDAFCINISIIIIIIIIMRVPFFLLFGFNKETPNQKGQKGTTVEPSHHGGTEGTVQARSLHYDSIQLEPNGAQEDAIDILVQVGPRSPRTHVPHKS